MITPVDQGQLAFKLLISQYKRSPNFSDLIQRILAATSEDIEEQVFQIINMCDLDNANGNVLDAAGTLIGLARMGVKLPGTQGWQLDVTPFTGHAFGDASYIEYETADDETYRDAIKSYAICQTTFCDLTTLQQCIAIILKKEPSDIDVELTASMAVTINVTEKSDERRRYLIEEFRTPNGSFLWPANGGVVYSFNIAI